MSKSAPESAGFPYTLASLGFSDDFLGLDDRAKKSVSYANSIGEHPAPGEPVASSPITVPAVDMPAGQHEQKTEEPNVTYMGTPKYAGTGDIPFDIRYLDVKRAGPFYVSLFQFVEWMRSTWPNIPIADCWIFHPEWVAGIAALRIAYVGASSNPKDPTGPVRWIRELSAWSTAMGGLTPDCQNHDPDDPMNTDPSITPGIGDQEYQKHARNTWWKIVMGRDIPQPDWFFPRPDMNDVDFKNTSMEGDD